MDTMLPPSFRPRGCRPLTSECLLLPLGQEGIEVDTRTLNESAEQAGLNKRAGPRGIPDVMTLADVEERHLIPRHEGYERVVVVRDPGVRRDAILSQGRRLFGQSTDCLSRLTGRHDRVSVHWSLQLFEDACSVHVTRGFNNLDSYRSIRDDRIVRLALLLAEC